MARRYRRGGKGTRRTKRYGGKPSPATLQKSENKEKAVPCKTTFVIVAVPFSRRDELEDEGYSLWPKLQECIKKKSTYPSFGHVPVSAWTAVFHVPYVIKSNKRSYNPPLCVAFSTKRAKWYSYHLHIREHQ